MGNINCDIFKYVYKAIKIGFMKKKLTYTDLISNHSLDITIVSYKHI